MQYLLEHGQSLGDLSELQGIGAVMIRIGTGALGKISRSVDHIAVMAVRWQS